MLGKSLGNYAVINCCLNGIHEHTYLGGNPTSKVVDVNDSPIAAAATVTTDEDTVATGTLTGADVDGNTLTFAKVADPSHGTVSINATTGAFTYTPVANYNGRDSFTFKVNDGTVDSAVATVSITVAAVNDAPVAGASTITTDEDTAKSGTLTGTDVDGNTLTFAKVADPSHGTVSINASTGAYTYTPVGNYNGSDSFTFKVNDGTVDSAVATVSITVAAVNDAPVGTMATIATDEDTAATGTLSGTDIDGNTLTFAKVADPSHGTVSINATTGAYTYTPAGNYNGSDSFTFKVNDGTVDSAVATVSINVAASQYDFTIQAHTWRGIPLSGVRLSEDKQSQASLNGKLELTDIFDSEGPKDGFMSVTPINDAPTTAASTGVTLTDVLAALKIYLGKSLPDEYASPYSYIAADFDGNGSVNLTDVLSLLKFYLGKTTTATPSWVFVDSADVTGTGKTASILRAGSDSLPIDATHTQPHAIDQDFSKDSSIELVGVLRGDVDGSWTAGS